MSPALKMLMRAAMAAHTGIYRMSGGRILGKFRSGAPVCLLTTTGRKSGKRRTIPLLYLQDGDNVVIVASMGGQPKHPIWYLNLEADPNVEVQIGGDRTPMIARTAPAEEKAVLWPKLVAMYSDYADYKARTERDIPVVVLSKASST